MGTPFHAHIRRVRRDDLPNAVRAFALRRAITSYARLSRESYAQVAGRLDARHRIAGDVNGVTLLAAARLLERWRHVALLTVRRDDAQHRLGKALKGRPSLPGVRETASDVQPGVWRPLLPLRWVWVFVLAMSMAMSAVARTCNA